MVISFKIGDISVTARGWGRLHAAPNGGVETRVASEAIVILSRGDFKLSDDCSAFLSGKPPMYRQQQLDRRTQ